MATLTRTRIAHDDVSDTTRDLRLGVPSPFPSNALPREEDELLDSLAGEELHLDDVLRPPPLPSPPLVSDQRRVENALRESDGLHEVQRQAVSCP